MPTFSAYWIGIPDKSNVELYSDVKQRFIFEEEMNVGSANVKFGTVDGYPSVMVTSESQICFAVADKGKTTEFFTNLDDDD